MLSLAGYTKDACLHSALYHGSTATNSKIAVFAVTNQTSRLTFLYWRGSVQVRTPTGWEEDQSTEVASEEVTSPIGPRQSETIKFPVPDGSGRWRCSVFVLDDTYSMALRPKWQGTIIDMLRHAGIKLERSHVIWSPELTR